MTQFCAISQCQKLLQWTSLATGFIHISFSCTSARVHGDTKAPTSKSVLPQDGRRSKLPFIPPRLGSKHKLLFTITRAVGPSARRVPHATSVYSDGMNSAANVIVYIKGHRRLTTSSNARTDLGKQCYSRIFNIRVSPGCKHGLGGGEWGGGGRVGDTPMYRLYAYVPLCVNPR